MNESYVRKERGGRACAKALGQRECSRVPELKGQCGWSIDSKWGAEGGLKRCGRGMQGLQTMLDLHPGLKNLVFLFRLMSSNREETMTRFAFENNYFGYTVKSRAGKGVGRMMTGVCSHPGKRGADGICQGGIH